MTSPQSPALTTRPATEADLPALAALHLANWRGAYRGIVPDAALDAPAAAHMRAVWTPAILEAMAVRVVTVAGEIVGFIVCVPPAAGAETTPWEVENLHVAAAHRGKGIGRCLMSAAAALAGSSPIRLTVLDGNTAGRAAYRAWGGTESAPFEQPFLGVQVRDRAVTWPSGRALARALAAGS